MIDHDDTKPALGFISYSHKDKAWLERVRTFMAPLERHGRLELWDDRDIEHGDKWWDKIRTAMEQARVGICLISADFLESKFCMKEEIPYLIERAEAEGLLFLPIMAEPCFWDIEPWLDKRQIKPEGAKPLSECPDWKSQLTGIVAGINKRLDDLKERKEALRKAAAEFPKERVDIDRLPSSGKELFARKEDLQWLEAQWNSKTAKVASLVAWGGVGKSALVNRWLEGLAARDWDGAARVFGWSFYSQGSHENSGASADKFFIDALTWFGAPIIEGESAWDKGARLAGLVRRQKTLLILDGLEPLQWATGDAGRVRDPALAMLIEELAGDNNGLCVITTRQHVTGLEDFPDTTVERDLHLLPVSAGRALLRVRGVRGTDRELERLSAAFGNHALAVALVASWLRGIDKSPATEGLTIPDLPWVKEKERPPRRVLAAFAERLGEGAERQVLRLIGLFDRPATAEELKKLRAAPAIPDLTDQLPVDAGAWNALLDRLRELRLVAKASEHDKGGLDAHPLVRSHFQDELRASHPEAWRAGNDRLYRYWVSVPTKPLPDTLEELHPLYIAIPHGCAAGHYQQALDEVHFRRIQRNNEYYSTHKLGAYGADLAALAAFFDFSPDGPAWTRPVATLTEHDRAELVNQAGFCLRALGRLTEAVEPLRAALEICYQEKNWRSAAINASNLSELLVTLGRLVEAEDAARQAVELADRSEDAFQRLARRATWGDALHQCGKTGAALELFEQTEEMQRQDQPHYPLLYSVQGYQYCDLLLSLGRAAEVRQRVEQLFEWRTPGDSALSIALEHLALGRAEAAADGDPAKARHFLDQGVDGLRKAASQHHLPRGLLARAGFRRQQGDFDAARRDLAEASRIAKRGDMRLHLIDHDLELARLLRAETPGADISALLAAARAAIADTGYHRRDAELEDLSVRKT
ncbi:MAG: TIR domain-containing protein [Rhodospirillaceae bacterium]